MNVGERIKYYREKQNLTQEKLGIYANMDSNNISRLERGESIPSLETLIKLCKALKATPNNLLMFEYDAPLELLNDDLAKLMLDLSSSDYKKIFDYINYIKSTK